MPFPLLAIPLVATAAYGLYKSGKAVVDHSNASDINDGAEALVSKAQGMVKSQRDASHSVLEDYGSRKLRAFNGVIGDFIATFGRLKNVEEIRTPELEKLQLGDFSTQVLGDLQRDYQVLQDSGLGIGAGLGGGAALAFGAYNGTMLLATASTGTAITTLSGAAATNATLAWLGGGSLAAGGAGVAGGAMVLGGLVAAPALAIFGFIVGSKAEAALADAKSNKERAKTYYEQAKLTVEKLEAISTVTVLANKVFSKVSSRLRKSVHDLEGVIGEHGEDYRTYPAESRAIVFRAVKFAQLIKAMIDTPILDEDGALVLATEKRVQEFSEIAGS